MPIHSVVEENNGDQPAFPSKFRITSVIVFIGAAAVLGLLILAFIAPEEALSLDQAGDINEFYSTVRVHQQVALLGIILDTIFVAGYIALFCGLWLVIRDFTDILGTVSILLGLAVGIGDLIENAMLFSLILGIPRGWTPDPGIFTTLWSMNQFIDITSYVAAIFFGVQFVLVYPHQRLKLGVGLLLLGYALVGLLAIIAPVLFLVRSAVFVIGLVTGAYMLFHEHEFTDEELMELLTKSQEKTDYIR